MPFRCVVPAGQYGLTRETDAAVVVDRYDLDYDFIADFDDVFNFLNAKRRDLPDVQKASCARLNLYEGTDLDDARDITHEGLVDVPSLVSRRNGGL